MIDIQLSGTNNFHLLKTASALRAEKTMIAFFVLASLAFHQGISKDVTPPTCSFCPGDIVREVPNAYERVSWDDPKCSDNSNVPPVITSNYPNGRLFKVPGTYKVQYFVIGKKGDIYKGCSFNITLTLPKCPMYDAPENGALVCLNRDADGSASFCQVACKDGTDFNFDPPLLYICAGPGFWMTEILRRVNQLPWPNCSSGAGPSMQKRNGFKEFFFNGNQTHSEIVTTLKQNLLTIAKGPKVPPIYCLHEACTPQKVQVYLSKQT